MVKKVKWNKTALLKLSQMASYLENEGHQKAAENLAENVVKKIGVICQFPECGRRSGRSKTMRALLVDNYRYVYYRVSGSTLIICNFFDGRQDPKKRPYK